MVIDSGFVLTWIIVRPLLAISSIHELTSISIDFVFDFPQAGLDVDVFMELSVVRGVDGNRA